MRIRRVRRSFCALSIAVNRLTGGLPGQTLCARLAAGYGDHCAFCRAVGWVLGEPDHCRSERLWDIKHNRR